MSARPGALALVLHSHMPYVEGFDTWPFGEEWLWEAVACVYLPLLEVLDGAPLTLGLTPVLCDQLEAMPDGAGERCMRFLREMRRTVHELDSAALDEQGEQRLAAELRRAAADYESAAGELERRSLDVLNAFAALERVELWTSAATHALLPLMATTAGLRLQLATGIASHTRRFGAWGGGLWLPECAYAPGLEHDLADDGVRAFCVDQTAAWGLGAPEHLRPVQTEAGPVAVPIDWQTVELVWHSENGYPADGRYRNYHQRTVHDLRPWDNAGRPYDRDAALAAAREHARHFVSRARERVADGGLLCCAVDTELLGHWWYEGPAWLAAVLREARDQGLEMVTVSEGLEQVEAAPAPLQASTWGTGKDLSTWDSPPVAEIAFAARSAELRTVAAAALHPRPREALARAARELLALQSSDWAFLVTRGLAADYGWKRSRSHDAGNLEALRALSGEGPVPEPGLRSLAPDLHLASLTTP
jgi:1,4-alpha-glucan branching enzyme